MTTHTFFDTEAIDDERDKDCQQDYDNSLQGYYSDQDPNDPPPLTHKNKKPKKQKYRLAAKRFFLTYPKCDTPKEQVMANLHTRFEKTLRCAMVAHELHADGSNHIHVAFELSVRREFTKPSCFDDLAGQHGSYEAIRDWRAAVQYLSKVGLALGFNLSINDF